MYSIAPSSSTISVAIALLSVSDCAFLDFAFAIALLYFQVFADFLLALLNIQLFSEVPVSYDLVFAIALLPLHFPDALCLLFGILLRLYWQFPEYNIAYHFLV